MKMLAAACTLLVLSAGTVPAQTVPFDMSGERLQEETQPEAEQPAAVPSDAATTGVDANPTAETAVRASFRRPLLPFERLELAGELDRKTWSVYVTSEQASTSAKLAVGYRNAVVVAPEASRLRIEINGIQVGEEQIASADGIKQLTFDIPQSALRPGSNLITIQASQRHRTDCSTQSTYELWSDIDPKTTYLDFGPAAVGRFRQMEDIAAVGVDTSGATQFHFIAPALDQPTLTGSLLRLTQGVALIGNMPNQSFLFDTSLKQPPGPGQMAIFVGTQEELSPLLPQLPAGAATGPVASFVDFPGATGPVLVISGPTWQVIDGLIENILAPRDRPLSTPRDVLLTERWRSPDAPLLLSERSIPLSQLGIQTQEFSGRRMRTDFTVGMPGDFYAEAYGEAQILLDAAYTEVVLPGSHIDVYVNGNIASTVPITTPGGGIFRHLPIRVTMRHFQAGLNTVTLEAVLLTQEDAVCAPGSTASDAPRFALFDTSEFHMPSFARVGQVPNLSATFGMGFPYENKERATPLYVERLDTGTLSAAATFMGLMAQAAGRTIVVETVSTPLKVGDSDAIFIGSISQIPQAVLNQMRIDATTVTRWSASTGRTGNEATTTTRETFDEWRNRLRGGSWHGQVTAFQEWFQRNFDISARSLRFAPHEERPFRPPDAATLMLAQASSPSLSGTWTLVSAPSEADLWAGMLAIVEQRNRSQIEGSFTVYDGKQKSIETTPVNNLRFVETQPPSLSNYRLIAANWLSTNILSYALALVALSVLLGIATAGLLTNFGRQNHR